MTNKICPSLMCMRIPEYTENLAVFRRTGIEYLHIDVMDGEFVPNYQFGVDTIKQLRSMSDIPLDIHLMITRPDEKLEWFDIQPGEYVSIHYESTVHAQRVLSRIRDRGGRPILALNPATPLCCVENVLEDVEAILLMTVNPGYAGQKIIPQTIQKTAALRKMLDDRGFAHVGIEVDGNISFENARLLADAGANMFVAGSSSVFLKGTPVAENIARMREAIRVE